MSIGARVEATGPAADLAESLPAEPPLLSVGIVVYGSDLDLLERTLDSLEAALGALPRAGGTACPVFVVDNGPPEYSSRLAARLAARGPWPVVLSGHGNVGSVVDNTHNPGLPAYFHERSRKGRKRLIFNALRPKLDTVGAAGDALSGQSHDLRGQTAANHDIQADMLKFLK